MRVPLHVCFDSNFFSLFFYYMCFLCTLCVRFHRKYIGWLLNTQYCIVSLVIHWYPSLSKPVNGIILQELITFSARPIKLCKGDSTKHGYRPAEVFLQGLQCTEDAIYIGHVNTCLVCMVTYFGTVNMHMALNVSSVGINIISSITHKARNTILLTSITGWPLSRQCKIPWHFADGSRQSSTALSILSVTHIMPLLVLLSGVGVGMQ